MVDSYRKRKGESDNPVLSDDEFMDIVCRGLANEHLKAPYTYSLMKCILDLLDHMDGSYILSFQSVFSGFAPIYWELVGRRDWVLFDENSRSKVTKAEKHVQDVKRAYGATKEQDFYALSPQAREQLAAGCVADCSKNVLGVFFDATGGKLFSFSKYNKTITLNPNAYHFLRRKKRVIEQINCLEWAKYLEKLNPTVNMLINTLAKTLHKIGPFVP